MRTEGSLEVPIVIGCICIWVPADGAHSKYCAPRNHVSPGGAPLSAPMGLASFCILDRARNRVMGLKQYHIAQRQMMSTGLSCVILIFGRKLHVIVEKGYVHLESYPRDIHCVFLYPLDSCGLFYPIVLHTRLLNHPINSQEVYSPPTYLASL
jgi:hypothetical protein